MTELADGARLLSECGDNTPPRVRIPLSPPQIKTWLKQLKFQPGFVIENCLKSPQQGALDPPFEAAVVFDVGPAILLFDSFENNAVIGLPDNFVFGSRAASVIDFFIAKPRV